MKKVLFITYYWPPSAKASLHWPLYIIKYLPEFNWEPSVLTVEEDKFSGKDESLLKEINPSLRIIRTKSYEPFDIYRKFLGKKKDEKLIASETISKTNKSFNHKISVWIRMNLFIPDARAGWYFPAVKSGEKFLREENIDAVISIGPPHTSHLIGRKLSKKFNIKHYPVFIDPWTDISYYKDFKRSRITLMIDKYLEKKVLENAERIIFVTNTMKEDYIKKYNFIEKKSDVLYWGYNEESFKMEDGRWKMEDGKWKMEDGREEILLHTGNIFDNQNPEKFWMTIKNEIKNGRNLKLKFTGTVSPGIKNSIEKAGLKNHVEYLGFFNYEEMLKKLFNADYLLVCATEPRHLPGKLFEYMRTGKPIIAFGNDNSEVKKILEDTNSGMIFRYDEDAKEFFSKASYFNTNYEKVKQFDRKIITEKLAKILDRKKS